MCWSQGGLISKSSSSSEEWLEARSRLFLSIDASLSESESFPSGFAGDVLSSDVTHNKRRHKYTSQTEQKLKPYGTITKSETNAITTKICLFESQQLFCVFVLVFDNFNSFTKLLSIASQNCFRSTTALAAKPNTYTLLLSSVRMLAWLRS